MVMTKAGQLISTSRDSTVRVNDIFSGQEHHVIDLSPSWACTIAVTECNTYFATGSFDNSINIYGLKSGEHMRHLRVFNLGILCLRFPIDLEYVVVGSSEGYLQQIPL
jgi:WD40 repeat protein